MAQFQLFLSDGIDPQGGDWSRGVLLLSREEAALAIRKWVHSTRLFHLTVGGAGYMQVLEGENPQELIESFAEFLTEFRNA